MDHRIDGRRFSGSGTSGQDHKTAVCRLNDCRLLHLIQLDLIFFLDLSDPLFDCLTVFLACNIQLMQHARRTLRREVPALSEAAPVPADRHGLLPSPDSAHTKDHS